MNQRATYEATFQANIIKDMVAAGWQLGTGAGYHADSALYEQDALDYVQQTQPKAWAKLERIYPHDAAQKFIAALVTHLNKANTASAAVSRTYGTLGVLRHGMAVHGVRFSLCQFRPEHRLNPDVIAQYERNICRIVPELVYSPHTRAPADAPDTRIAKRGRIDIVLFINGLPVVTMELKSEFKQDVNKAIEQYRSTRQPKDPETGKPEPLLTFKRGALVHFAVSQFTAHMSTHLAGKDTTFLPFNKGTKDGQAGNDIPLDINRYATDYLWREVLTPAHLLTIIGRFMHLQVVRTGEPDGKAVDKETMIFPRYHQWDVVRKLVDAAITEGAGHRYLIQHSAGSGKSNSIAWTAHQLSTLHDDAGNKQFDSVIVITDRTVLDDQLQETIYQFEHASGVVERITKGGVGSKSERLADALTHSKPIIIVTIQTFPHVLKAIEDSSVLRARRYAIIADEAHSSQTGATATQLKQVLQLGEGEGESAEDKLAETVSARADNHNLSYYAFTATPKEKTVKLFGRLPDPSRPESAEAGNENLPQPYHVYSMRQAIEEKFILDVLKNYTSYKVVYQLKQDLQAADDTVDARRAKIKLNQWVRLHDHNISQKVKIIIEHFKKNVRGLLGGQAKAMVVTSSRKAAVRYKLAFDAYIAEHGYTGINAMVAFSGEVRFDDNDPNSSDLLGQSFTEQNMNPALNKRDMREAFDSDDYQVMLVANKFQTGFDQPKLCAMYVDKKLGGVDCVQTLSRLNRTYKGKLESGTFILDFVNTPEEIQAAFAPYYTEAKLGEVSDPNAVFELYDSLYAAHIFTQQEVTQLANAFYDKNTSDAALGNICKPAVDRWQKRYEQSQAHIKDAKAQLSALKGSDDAALIHNAKMDYDGYSEQRAALETFKRDLGRFTRMYEFLSQIVDYDSVDLEKLNLYARHLQPLLRERAFAGEDIDLTNIAMTHYRISKIHQQDIQLQADGAEALASKGGGAGKGKPTADARLSQVVAQLNAVFDTEYLSERDLINYAHSIRDKLSENQTVMKQIHNNTVDQAMLGDFRSALNNAIMDSAAAHQSQQMQLLTSDTKTAQFARIVYDLLNVYP